MYAVGDILSTLWDIYICIYSVLEYYFSGTCTQKKGRDEQTGDELNFEDMLRKEFLGGRDAACPWLSCGKSHGAIVKV